MFMLMFFLQDMFSEELQAVPVELEQMDVTESSRLTEDHWTLQSNSSHSCFLSK